MGMRINGGGYANTSQSTQNTQWQQRRQNFDALAQAISANNPALANSAYEKITSQLPAGASINPDSFLGKIGSALKSSDLTSAQQILASRHHNDKRGTATASAANDLSVSSTSGVSASNAVAGVGGTSGTAASAGNRHHHHHADDGSSPALALNSAIQSGDSATAQSAMQTLVAALQQIANLSSMSNPNGSQGNGNAALSSANSLLQNPDFQALEDAVSKGNSVSMKSAWAKLISDQPPDATVASSSVAPAVPTTPVV